MKAKFPGFRKCIAMMRKRDHQTQEDGFHWLLPHAGEYVHELMEEFGKEKDLGLRCWFLELIGSAKSPDSFDFLASQLRAEDQRLRHWATWALKNLGTKEARALLREPQISNEEIERRLRNGGGRSLAEILADLEKDA